jgi:hypothetical protein
MSVFRSTVHIGRDEVIIKSYMKNNQKKYLFEREGYPTIFSNSKKWKKPDLKKAFDKGETYLHDESIKPPPKVRLKQLSYDFKEDNNLATLYTIGYGGGKSPEWILSELKKNNIKTLLDVRQSPKSRREEFNSKELVKFFKDTDVTYYHLKKAGNPFRGNTGYDDLEVALKTYREYIFRNKIVDTLLKAFRRLYLKDGFPAAMMCVCEDQEKCHRGVLSEEIKNNSKLRIIHLPEDEQKKLFE